MAPDAIDSDVGRARLKIGGVTQQGKLPAQGVISSVGDLGPEVFEPSNATAKSTKNAKEPLAELLMASGTISGGQPTSRR